MSLTALMITGVLLALLSPLLALAALLRAAWDALRERIRKQRWRDAPL